MEILAQIKECTASVKKSSVEQTATMRAWSAVNNLQVDKFRKEVEDELAPSTSKTEDQAEGF